MTRELECLGQEVGELVRRRVLRRVLYTDANLRRMFGELAPRLRGRLGLNGVNEAELARALEEELLAIFEEDDVHVVRDETVAAPGTVIDLHSERARREGRGSELPPRIPGSS